MIYLASPYSDPDPTIEEARYILACAATVSLMEKGYMVFCPIVMCHPLVAHFGLKGNWDYWGQYDLVMLRKCDELYVLKLTGWENSEGVTSEIVEAKMLDYEITYIPEQP